MAINPPLLDLFGGATLSFNVSAAASVVGKGVGVDDVDDAKGPPKSASIEAESLVDNGCLPCAVAVRYDLGWTIVLAD